MGKCSYSVLLLKSADASTTISSRKRSRSNVLPVVSSVNELSSPHLTLHPAELLRSLVSSNSKQAAGNTIPITIQESSDYTMDAVQAIRAKDISKLRDMLKAGTSFDACNSNGEHLIHLACRCGNVETVKFLVHDASVIVNVRDNMGRSILHDACWKPNPDTDLMDVLLTVTSPELFLVKDHRGHIPFDYARKAHWPTWNRFLHERQDLIIHSLLANV